MAVKYQLLAITCATSHSECPFNTSRYEGMEKRKHLYAISKPQLVQPIRLDGQVEQHQQQPRRPQQQQQQQYAPVPPPKTNGTRPLSDIRELSEPSIIDIVAHRAIPPSEPISSVQRSVSPRRTTSVTRSVSARSHYRADQSNHQRSRSIDDPSSSYSSTPEHAIPYTIPYSSIPRRSSSQTHAQRPTQSDARKASLRTALPPPPPPPPILRKLEAFTVPNHGPSRSPVKAAATRTEAVSSESARRVPSRTYIRTPNSTDILEFPTYRHPRIDLDLRVSAPLFVGGGSIEGQVDMIVDGNETATATIMTRRSRRSLGIAAMSVDLLGFEELPASGRRAAFLAVGTDVIDVDHPPPANMIESANLLAPADKKFWTLVPSSSKLQFMISLPLNTGPPPFQSRMANIRYLLCVTTVVNDAGKHYRVRTSQDVNAIPPYDPEKALTSLASPLTATDEMSLPHSGRCGTFKVTAGLHRQVWVSGGSIFADVHITNKTHKPVKRLELSLERDILCYRHTPAGTGNRSASNARIFESNEQTMITRSTLKPGQQGWSGVPAHGASETRTCELELPRGHATVRCGRYFEVRYFLNVTASLSNTKLVSVQLPIILIHMNSLDVLPNSVAQVAAAIEEKRARGDGERNVSRLRSKAQMHTHSRQRSVSSPADIAGDVGDMRRRPSYSQGRAFAAPRHQPESHQRAVRSVLDDLQRTLDSSPRKFQAKMHKVQSGARSANAKTRDQSVAKSRITQPSGGGSGGGSGISAPFSRNDTFNNLGSHDSRTGRWKETRKLLPRMASLDSMWSKRSMSLSRRGKAQRAEGGNGPENVKPQYQFTVVRGTIDPHTLGLGSSDSRGGGAAGGVPVISPWDNCRPATALEVRDQDDEKRFGFKTEGKKPIDRNGTSMMQVSQGCRENEREGWI